jgi:hypothetical protein
MSNFNGFRPNSVREVTGNFIGRTGKFLKTSREFFQIAAEGDVSRGKDTQPSNRPPLGGNRGGSGNRWGIQVGAAPPAYFWVDPKHELVLLMDQAPFATRASYRRFISSLSMLAWGFLPLIVGMLVATIRSIVSRAPPHRSPGRGFREIGSGHGHATVSVLRDFASNKKVALVRRGLSRSGS